QLTPVADRHVRLHHTNEVRRQYEVEQGLIHAGTEQDGADSSALTKLVAHVHEPPLVWVARGSHPRQGDPATIVCHRPDPVAEPQANSMCSREVRNVLAPLFGPFRLGLRMPWLHSD